MFEGPFLIRTANGEEGPYTASEILALVAAGNLMPPGKSGISLSNGPFILKKSWRSITTSRFNRLNLPAQQSRPPRRRGQGDVKAAAASVVAEDGLLLLRKMPRFGLS
jgi:hypothetical protein